MHRARAPRPASGAEGVPGRVFSPSSWRTGYREGITVGRTPGNFTAELAEGRNGVNDAPERIDDRSFALFDTPRHPLSPFHESGLELKFHSRLSPGSQV